MRRTLIMVLSLLLFATGCAHQISEKSLKLADRSISFAKLRENPDAYCGKFVVLGGVVAAVKDVQEGTQLEVIQHELDGREVPDETSVSGGRFLAITPDFLDVSSCRPGALVSLAGEVAGKKIQTLQRNDYTYPVIIIKELHFVRAPDESFPTRNPYAP